MINLERLPAHEAERLAYAEGFTGTAALFGRIADLQKALGEAVATIDAIANNGMNARQCQGAAREYLDTHRT